MPYVKNTSYSDMIFSLEAARGDFYTFSNVAKLAAKIENNKEEALLCRTVGILHSSHGRFYLTDVPSPSLKPVEAKIQLSMVYLKSPPQSTVMPYPVQVFGTLRWKKQPVVIVKILQVLATSMALRLCNILNAVADVHLAKPELQDTECEEAIL